MKMRKEVSNDPTELAEAEDTGIGMRGNGMRKRVK